MLMLSKSALDALTDQAFAATADMRGTQPRATLADAGELAEIMAGYFRGDETAGARAAMVIAMQLGSLLARYEQFPGGIELVPAVVALAAEQVAREAGAS